jgi:hypothetical protein
MSCISYKCESINSIKPKLTCVLLTLNAAFSVNNDVMLFLKIWMNAPMEPTCAANMQTVRTPWALIAVSVRRDTQEMASLVQVGCCWDSCKF